VPARLFSVYNQNMDNNLIKEISHHIKEYEGFSSLVYECTAGYQTIGYGRNIEQKGITKSEAEFLLHNDLEQSIKEISNIVKDFNDLPDKVKLVLIDMTYNLGLSKLLTFEKMLDAIDAKNWEKAAEELLDSKYARQTKRRARMNASYLIACGYQKSD
jgi:lysozyme